MSTDTHPDYSWSAHPARERVGAAAAGVGVIGAFAAMSGVLMQSPWWAVISAVLLVLFLNRFFFPSRFTIDDDGITATYPFGRKRMLWQELRRFGHGVYGGFLSTRARPARMDRGMHVLFGRDRDPVVERIRDRLSDGDGA